MKRITLIRHAKSCWKDDTIADFDRGLNKRGKRDAPMMARRMLEYAAPPDLILVSPAKRALLTANLIAPILGYRLEQLQLAPSLYEGTEQDILSVIQGLPDDFDQVFIIGHNPGLNEFIWRSTDFVIDNLPTCGVFCLSYAITQWADADFQKSRFQYYDYPKNTQALICAKSR